jgi:hypothetical protein
MQQFRDHALDALHAKRIHLLRTRIDLAILDLDVRRNALRVIANSQTRPLTVEVRSTATEMVDVDRSARTISVGKRLTRMNDNPAAWSAVWLASERAPHVIEHRGSPPRARHEPCIFESACRKAALANTGNRRFSVGYDAAAPPVFSNTRSQPALLVGSRIWYQHELSEPGQTAGYTT